MKPPKRLAGKTPTLLQLAVIVLMSVVAGYAFQNTETVYKVNNICFYRFLAYGLAVFLGFQSFSYYKKSVALVFSAALSVVAFSPIGMTAIELFPLVVPFLATLMGAVTVLFFPSSRGRGFSEFLFALILPAILEKSRIGGSMSLLATTRSLSSYELAAVTVCIVGGYFYLRYMMLANRNSLLLLSNGVSEDDVAEVNRWFNFFIILIVVVASGAAASLMVATSVFADVLQGTVIALPSFVLALTLSAGITLTAILYFFKLHHKENR